MDILVKGICLKDDVFLKFDETKSAKISWSKKTTHCQMRAAAASIAGADSQLITQ